MDFDDQLKHINSIHFTKDSLRHARAFMKSKKETQHTPVWAVKYRAHLRLDRNDPTKIFLFKRQIIPKESRSGFLRKLFLDPNKKGSNIPFGIRSGYHVLIKHYLGITVRFLWDFLSKQEPIRKLDARAPASKPSGIKVAKLGHIEIDLIEVTYKDLDMKAPKRKKKKAKPKAKKPKAGVIPKKLGKPEIAAAVLAEEKRESDKTVFFIFSAVERVTGLTFLRYSKTKEMASIGTILEESFKYYSENLKIDVKSQRFSSDRGVEFGYKSPKEDFVFHKHGVINKWVDKASIVERRNRYIQQVFHRLRALGRAQAYPKMVERTMKIVNMTLNKNHKKTPLELVSEIKTGEKHLVTDMIKRYNSKRNVRDPQKNTLKPYEIGDKVRLLLVKRSKDTPLGYKSYRGEQYTKTMFQILARTKKEPYRYKIKVKGKLAWKTRDSLLKTSEYDAKTNKYLSNIKVKNEKNKEDEKLKLAAEEIDDERKAEAEKNKGRRRVARTVFPIFYDRASKKKFKIQNMVQFVKLQRRYKDIPRSKLKQKIVIIERR